MLNSQRTEFMNTSGIIEPIYNFIWYKVCFMIKKDLIFNRILSIKIPETVIFRNH